MALPNRLGKSLKKLFVGDDFFTSNLYLFLMAVATVTTWVTGNLFIVIAFYAVAMLLICLTQKTLAGILPIVATFVMGYSRKQSEVMQDISEPIIAASIFIAVMFICFFVFLIKNRKSLHFQYFPKVPYLLLIAATVFGGIGAGFWFTPQWAGGIAISVICFLALVALTTSNPKPLDKEFLCRIILMMGAIVVAETFAFYAKAYLAGNLDQAIVNKTLDYGWNMSNGGGMMILMSVPTLFYYATKRKFPIFEAIAFVILTFALLMTNSRGAQISYLIVILPTIIYSFVKSKHKGGFAAAITCGISIAAGIVFILFKNDSGFIERWMHIGMSDSGRFSIYEACLKEIASGNFLFGWGFFHAIPGVVWNNFLAHNTILQFWTDFGILGLIAFGALVLGNYRVTIRKNGTWGVLMGLALLAPGIHGLLDVNYFTPFYMPMLLVFVAIASNVTEFRKKQEKEDAKKHAEERKCLEEEQIKNEKVENEIPHIKEF